MRTDVARRQIKSGTLTPHQSLDMAPALRSPSVFLIGSDALGRSMDLGDLALTAPMRTTGGGRLSAQVQTMAGRAI
jgi:hypothetical protein